MDFEGLIAAARAVETLEEATAWLDRAFAQAIETFGIGLGRGSRREDPRRAHHAGRSPVRRRGSHGGSCGARQGSRPAKPMRVLLEECTHVS